MRWVRESNGVRKIFFFFQAEDGIRDYKVTGVQTCALPIFARVRGNDWLYSYMRGFYVDPARPYGYNNTVFPSVGMPHVLAPLQGRQVLPKIGRASCRERV